MCLRDMLPDSPQGMRGVLAKLPSRVLAAEDYRSIRSLLSRRNAANILRHTRNIDESLIKLLEGVPDDLCRPVMACTPADMWYRMSRFIDGLQIVARRLGTTLDNIIAELAAANATPTAFRAQLEAVVERLPLPDTLPPAVLGKACRIDRPSDLRRLARAWSNCLTDYIEPVQAGEVAFYCWAEAEADTAICQVDRAGRLGWVISDIKGRKNSPVRSKIQSAIYEAFAAIDIHPAAIMSPIETLLLGLNFTRKDFIGPD